MGTILDGRPVAELIYQDISRRAEKLKSSGIEPRMIILRVGENKGDISYEKSIIKNCEKAGIKAFSEAFSAEASPEEFMSRLRAANANKSIHAIMIMRPLPAHINEKAVQEAIDPSKDIDCISEANMGAVFTGGAKIFPCTAQAVIKLLKHYNILLSGKNVTVAGRSAVVGKPLSLMLLNENATVTMCHSKTADLAFHTKSSDITVAAIGKPKFFGLEYFDENSIVIDVGVNYDAAAGKMCGDADFENLKDFVEAVTPPTGGIGVITTAVLLENTIRACEIQNNGE